MKVRFTRSAVAALACGMSLLSVLTACDYGPWEDEDDHHGHSDSVVIIDPKIPSDQDGTRVKECSAVSSSTYYFNDDESYNQTRYYCYEKQPYRYTTSCDASSCSQVKVYVHYGLKDTLGEAFTVHLEAFDNPSFNGYPIGKVEISAFKAEPGYWKDADLWLPQGEFYLRAFLSNDESPNVPYQFGDMVLIQDQPVGVFGVLSGPQMVRVDYHRRYTDPVSIHLDQLFKKPGSEPETNARLRTVVKFPDAFEIQTGKEVKIEVHKTEDFEASPVAAMTIKSELFMIQGQSGKAEVVSASMEPGTYYIRAYYDLNQNGFFDDGELQSVHGGLATPQRIAIEKDHTRSLTLMLATP